MSYTTSTSASFALTVGQSVAVRTQLNEGAKVRIYGVSADREFMVNDANSKTFGPFTEAKTVTVTALYGSIEYDYGAAPNLPAFVYTTPQTESADGAELAIGYGQNGRLASASMQALADSGLTPGARGVFNLKASNTKYWQIARAKARSKQSRARVGICGTSLWVGQGSNAATPTNATNAQVLGPVNQLALLLSAVGTPAVNSSFFGDGCAARYSQTLPVQDPRITFGANWSSTFSNTQIWPGGSAVVYTNGAVNNLSFAPAENTDSAKIWYYSFASNGSFTTNVNGGASLGTTTTSTSPNQILSSATFTFTRGVNVLNIVPGNNGGITILGVEMWDSTVPAVNLLNFSHRGAAIADFTFINRNTVPGIVLPVLNTYGPIDLWINSLTVNDANQAGNFSTQAEYRARLDALVTYQLSSGASDVWLAIDPPSNLIYSTNGTIDAYVAIVYEIAAKHDLPVFDMLNRWTSYTSNTQYYVADGVHLSAPGYADEAAMYAAAMSQPV